MIANRRLVVRIRLERVYGIISTSGRRPQKRSDDAGADDADK
jgi:hypothetical protein